MKTSRTRIATCGLALEALIESQSTNHVLNLTVASFNLDLEFQDLFFEPFDQIMRLQLLASAMERNGELEADIVSVLHIGPRSNEGMLNPLLANKVGPGTTIGEIWRNAVVPGRFKALATEDLIPLLVESGADPAWAEYIKLRYGAMV